MAASKQKQYTLGRGRLYFDAFLAGTTDGTGERYLGNTTEFNISVESESLEHFDSDEGIRQKDKSVILELTRSGSLTTDNMNDENVALFLLGEISTVTQEATPVTAEPLGTVQGDRYYQVGKTDANPQGVRQITAVTVNFGVTPGVLDTDYTVDLELGRVYFIEGGLADGATEATIDYTPTAGTRTRVQTTGDAAVTGALRFVSANATGPQRDWYMPSVDLAPSGDLALKGDDWQTAAFEVSVNKLPGMESIYLDGRPAL